jgi:hypothetical protein
MIAQTAPNPQLAGADWAALAAELDAVGCARTPRLLTAAHTVRSGRRHALGLVFHDA